MGGSDKCFFILCAVCQYVCSSISKVKVLYKFSQMGGLDVPQRNDRYVGDPPIIFGHHHHDNRLQRLLNEVLQVTPEDLPILQNWRSALSKEYKAHLMHSN